jgi:hypothetical protein
MRLPLAVRQIRVRPVCGAINRSAAMRPADRSPIISQGSTTQVPKAIQTHAFGISKAVRASSAVSSLKHGSHLNVRNFDSCIALPQLGHVTN